MPLKSVFPCAAILLALGAPALAKDCDSDASMSQRDLNACYSKNFTDADAALNKKYKLIVDCLKPASVEAKPLIEAQRAWLKFRDLECKFQGAGSEGGSIHPMVVTGCLTSLTEQRNKGLDYYLTCQEGDSSCPTSSCGFAKEKSKRP